MRQSLPTPGGVILVRLGRLEHARADGVMELASGVAETLLLIAPDFAVGSSAVR
jgi:hypothetical protein